MPKDMELDEASLRKQKGVIGEVKDFEEGKGIETTNAHKEYNDEGSLRI